MKTFMKAYGAGLIGLSLVAFAACAFPGVAVEWTAAQQWTVIVIVSLSTTTGIAMIVAGDR